MLARNDWEQRKLGDIKDVRDGTHDSPKYQSKGFPLVTSKNLTEKGLDLNNVSLISEEDYTAINKRSKVVKGDILFAMIGTIGNPVLVNRDDFAIKNVALIKAGGEVRNEFLIYLLQSTVFERFIRRENEGNTQKFLGLTKIRNFKFRFPSMLEQNKIGLLLGKLDETIALHQKELEKTQKIREKYMRLLFPRGSENVPFIRLTNFKEDWEHHELGSIGNTYSGLSGKKKEDFGHGNAEFITYLNVFNNHISDITMTDKIEIDDKQFEVKYGDVLFTTSSETPHEVGMSSVWLDHRPNVYLNSFCFGFRPEKTIDYLYLAYVLRTPEVRKQFQLLAQGISRYNISKNKAMYIKIPLPSINEQEKIGRFLKNLDDLISFNKNKIDQLQILKNAFLQKMFI